MCVTFKKVPFQLLGITLSFFFSFAENRPIICSKTDCDATKTSGSRSTTFLELESLTLMTHSAVRLCAGLLLYHLPIWVVHTQTTWTLLTFRLRGETIPSQLYAISTRHAFPGPLNRLHWLQNINISLTSESNQWVSWRQAKQTVL